MQNRFIQILKFLLVLEEKHIMLIQNHQLEARYFFFVLLFSPLKQMKYYMCDRALTLNGSQKSEDF